MFLTVMSAPYVPGKPMSTEKRPLCFRVEGYQKNSVFDLSGSTEYRDNTESPLLFLPASPSSKDAFIGVGKLCADTDGKLYLSVNEYVPPSEGMKPDAKSDAAVRKLRTTGPDRHFLVGKLQGVNLASLKGGISLRPEQVSLESDLKPAFEKLDVIRYEDSFGEEGRLVPTFVITSTRAPKELTKPPVLAMVP